MLALPFGMSGFTFDSLLERPVPSSEKSFRQQESQQLHPLLASQLNDSNVGGHIEWKPEHFPHKMYDLLEDVERKGLDDIVSWLPDGKSFKIHSQIGFEQSIMPLYFSGMSSYKSFRRQLNLYGIYQHRHRPNQDANAYSHELLIRGQRHLCDNIARKKTNPPNKNKALSSSSKNDCGAGETSNKKRDRSSLLTMMDQRNMKTSPEPQVGKQEPMPVSSFRKSNNIMGRNMLDELSTRPNPVDIANIGKVDKNMISINRSIDTRNVFQSFMSQYWEDLPNNVSSAQVVEEIIATFQQ